MQKIIATLIVLFLLSFCVDFGIKSYASYLGNALEKQGDQLVALGKYEEALEKFKTSKDRHDTKEIDTKIDMAQQLIESEFNFRQGNNLVSQGVFEEAIDRLSKVDPNYINYKKALSLINYAQQQKDKMTGVLGVTNEPTPSVSP